MTIFKNFDFDIILSFLLGLCIGLLFSNTVYADDFWNENNNFDGNVKICAVEKSPKSEIYVISNLFF